MRILKKVLFLTFISITLIVVMSSCTFTIPKIDYGEQTYETMIKYVATLYNKGQYLDKDTVINSTCPYSQQVVDWYRYFMNLTANPPDYNKDISSEDETKLNNYVEKYKLDYWTSKDSTNCSKITYNPSNYPGYDNLVSKVRSIMTTFGNTFWTDVENLYPGFTTEDASNLAKFIVDSAIKISYSGLSFSNPSLPYDNVVFVPSVTINKDFIRPELLLAFAMVETSFEPFAYKLEQKYYETEEKYKIYAVSFGLAQILLDINLINSDIGLTDIAEPGDYTFTLLNRNYFSSEYKAENLFRVQTAELFKATFLQLLFDRIVRENWIQ
jgi:hypothetical protein